MPVVEMPLHPPSCRLGSSSGTPASSPDAEDIVKPLSCRCASRARRCGLSTESQHLLPNPPSNVDSLGEFSPSLIEYSTSGTDNALRASWKHRELDSPIARPPMCFPLTLETLLASLCLSIRLHWMKFAIQCTVGPIPGLGNPGAFPLSSYGAEFWERSKDAAIESSPDSRLLHRRAPNGSRAVERQIHLNFSDWIPPVIWNCPVVTIRLPRSRALLSSREPFRAVLRLGFTVPAPK